MVHLNKIGADAMIYARDHKTSCSIDPWDYPGPKRRRLSDSSRAGLFREHILSELSVHKIASCYTEGFGRLAKEIYAAPGALILQQMHDLTDDETVPVFLQSPTVLCPGHSRRVGRGEVSVRQDPVDPSSSCCPKTPHDLLRGR